MDVIRFNSAKSRLTVQSTSLKCVYLGPLPIIIGAKGCFVVAYRKAEFRKAFLETRTMGFMGTSLSPLLTYQTCLNSNIYIECYFNAKGQYISSIMRLAFFSTLRKMLVISHKLSNLLVVLVISYMVLSHLSSVDFSNLFVISFLSTSNISSAYLSVLLVIFVTPCKMLVISHLSSIDLSDIFVIFCRCRS